MHTTWGEVGPQSFSVRLPHELPGDEVNSKAVKVALPGVIIDAQLLRLVAFGGNASKVCDVPCFHIDLRPQRRTQKRPVVAWRLFLNFSLEDYVLPFLAAGGLEGQERGMQRVYPNPADEAIFTEKLSARAGLLVHGILFAPSRIPHLECQQPPPDVAVYAGTALLTQTVSCAALPAAP